MSTGEKLVTLAIHSYEKAQILKTLLESHNIEVFLHNVNLIQPVISAGVRVRIKESQLNEALRIIEDYDFTLAEDKKEEQKTVKKEKKVLVPIDFSDYSFQACKFAFNYASEIGAEVILLHAYFSTFFSNPLPIGDVISYDTTDDTVLKNIIQQVNKDISNFKNHLQSKMEKGEVPYVKFTTILREGVPEEEIIRVAKNIQPELIIMGTRGKHQKDKDIIGSVTAEVIDSTQVPLFAFPDQTKLEKLDDIKNLAFITNFDQRDFLSFQLLIDFFNDINFNIHFIHLENKNDAWNQIKLAGIKEYFEKQYPDKSFQYKLIKKEDNNDQLVLLENYFKEKNIDALSLTNKRRNIFARLFNPSIARRMLFHNDTPMLIFP